ncbi:MAG TPA: transposase [Roseiflexaceae bacterium]|nr:transposase [Roseiflexaceae bacterium]
MGYDPQRHHRRSIQLRGYDYRTCGAYFVTVCVRRHSRVLGQVHNGKVFLSEWGTIVERTWHVLPERFPVELDAFVIMPDHIHGMLWLISPETGGPRSIPADQAGGSHLAGKAESHPDDTDDSHPAGKGGSRPALTTKPLGGIIGALKTMSARQINVVRGTPGVPFWQRDFYERIVRDEAALWRIREYIRCNPQRWR